MLKRRTLWLWMALSAAAEAQDALQIRDYYRIESADEPSIAPDGALVAFTKHTINEAENARRSEIWLAKTDGSAPPRRITVPAFDASRPRFSSDGKLLSFRSRRRGVTSTWFLRSDGLGEAFEIEGVSGEAVVSPDSRLVAFTKTTLPTEPKPEPSGLEKELEARFEGEIYDWMQVRFDRRGYLPDPTDPYASPPRELYVVAAFGGEPKRLTSLGVDVEDFSWSADSLKLVFAADAHQRDAYAYERADLWIVDLEGQIERLTNDGFHHSVPAFSPNGTRIAYRRLKGLSLVIARRRSAVRRSIFTRWTSPPENPSTSPPIGPSGRERLPGSPMDVISILMLVSAGAVICSGRALRVVNRSSK